MSTRGTTGHPNPFLAIAYVLVLGSIGVIATFFPREYRDFNLRHQGRVPDWLYRLHMNSTTLSSIRICGLFALLMSGIVLYTFIASFWR